jgi:hypothetical protein
MTNSFISPTVLSVAGTHTSVTLKDNAGTVAGLLSVRDMLGLEAPCSVSFF